MKKILCTVLAAVIFTGCSASPNDSGRTEPVEPSAESYFELADSSELILQFPEELSAYVTRERSAYGSVMTETFYIKNGSDEIPLFRIDVGNRDFGDLLGVLQTKVGDVPVTYTVFAVSEEDMVSLGADAPERYGSLMQGFNAVLQGIMDDPRFAFEESVVGSETDVSMRYWTVTLPANMRVEETDQHGNYEARFIGNIQGEDIELYMIRIGDVTAETQIGMFNIDDVPQTVSVASFDLPEDPDWTDADYSDACRMMETINDVILVITQSEQFSAAAE